MKDEFRKLERRLEKRNIYCFSTNDSVINLRS